MKVSSFTYVRNGIFYDYPFLQAIQSILPLVDECIVVIGDSVDGTRKAVEDLNDPKIKIVDTVWDPNMRTGGYIFAQQANIGLDNVSKDADWIFHIQADELIHENDHAAIRQAMNQYVKDKRVEGFLFKFLNFFGDYKHYAPSRRFHQKEIRIIRNDPSFRSFRDSQGFRSFSDPLDTSKEKGRKLNVKEIDATVYHYSYAKNPKVQQQKQIAFGSRWAETDEWIKGYLEKYKEGHDYSEIDFLYEFKGTHPALMHEKIAAQDWTFHYDPKKNNMKFKEKVLKVVQDLTGKPLFIDKNYKII